MGKRVHYGWVVAGACFFYELVMLGLVNGTSSQYVKPICDDLGFSRGLYSMVFTLAAIASMVASLTFGKLYARLKNVKYFFVMGAAMASLAFLSYRYAQSLPLFFLGGMLAGVAIAWSAMVPLSIILSNWFVKKKGMVMGLVFAGSGIGGMILNPLVGYWISEKGWRVSYGNAFLVVLAVCIPALFLIKGTPEEMGLKPYGAEDEPEAPRSAQTKKVVPEARNLFPLMMLAVFLYGMAIQPVFVNSSPHFGGLGIPQTTIALITSLIFISNAVAKITLGAFHDQIGIRPVFLISQIFFILSVLILVFSKGRTGGFAFAAVYGVGYTVLSISTPLLAAHFFKGEAYGRRLGVLIAVQTAGSAIGTPLGGFSYDVFATYVPAFLLQMALGAMGTVLMLRLAARAGETYSEAVQPDM